MIASNKQRQEHNILATIWRAKPQGGPWALQKPLACPRSQMQTLTSMDKGVIEDGLPYDNNSECELDETNTFIVNFFTKP